MSPSLKVWGQPPYNTCNPPTIRPGGGPLFFRHVGYVPCVANPGPLESFLIRALTPFVPSAPLASCCDGNTGPHSGSCPVARITPDVPSENYLRNMTLEGAGSRPTVALILVSGQGRPAENLRPVTTNLFAPRRHPPPAKPQSWLEGRPEVET